MSTTWHLNLLAADNPLSHVVDVTMFGLPGTKFRPGAGEPGAFVLLSHKILLMLIAGVLVYWTMKYAARRADELRGKAPTGLYNLIETFMQFVRKDVCEPVLGAATDRFIGFMWTCFFFIMYNNLLGLLPLKEITGLILYGGGLIFTGVPDEHLLHAGIGGTPTGSIWITAALAACVFVLFIGAGIKENGVVGFAKHLTGGAPWYMAPIMVPVEIIGLFVKPFALAIRLFANMTAGHVLLAVLYGFAKTAYDNLAWPGMVSISLISALGATAVLALELFVALLQAYIFVFLSSLFIAQMIEHGDSEHEADEHAPHPHSGEQHHKLVAEGPGAHAIGESAEVLASQPHLPALYPEQDQAKKKH